MKIIVSPFEVNVITFSAIADSFAPETITPSSETPSAPVRVNSASANCLPSPSILLNRNSVTASVRTRFVISSPVGEVIFPSSVTMN